MDSRRLEIFLAAARRGSFAQAARELYISRSSASREVLALEKELGLSLFMRRGRSPLELTAAGRLLLEEAPALLEGQRRLEERLRAAAGENISEKT